MIHPTKKLVNTALTYATFVFCACLCFVLFVPRVHASVLFFNPQDRIVVEEGETTVVEARLDTEGKTVNALDATLLFAPDKLEVLDVSRGQSLFTLWVADPEVDNATGKVHFTGGIPGGGSSHAGLVATLTLRAKATGEAALGWDGASQVLLNNGLGTADTLTTLPTPLTIMEALTDMPHVSSTSHPDQSKWYGTKMLFVGWQLQIDAAYSYMLDHDPRGVPDEVPDTPKGELRFDGTIKYENLADGIYYFHLRKGMPGKDGVAWSRTRTYRAQIDSTPPAALECVIGSDASVFNGKLFVMCSAADALSGVARYDVQEAGGAWQEGVKLPFELRNQKSRQPITVRVADKAENVKEISVTIPKQPLRIAWGWFVGFVVVLAAAVGMWYRRLRSAKLKAQNS